MTKLQSADVGYAILYAKNGFGNSALYVTTLVKRPALAAYEIAKPYQARDREFGKLLNDAVNFYHQRAAAGARTRKSKKTP